MGTQTPLLGKIIGCGLLGAWLFAGCASVHPYSYSRAYEPLSEEEHFLEQEQDVSYEAVRRDPEAYENELLGWFGVVQHVEEGDPGLSSQVALELRFHQPRHLCASQDESTCRVTISDHDGGPFSARIVLRPGDRGGSDRVSPGSLLKVYGRVRSEVFDERGGPVLEAIFYRHFPTGTYVVADGDAPRRFRR